MAVRPRGVHAGILHVIRHGEILPVRMEQPPSVPPGVGHCRKPVFRIQQLLVHNRDVPAPRIRPEPEGQRRKLVYACGFTIRHAMFRARSLSRTFVLCM